MEGGGETKGERENEAQNGRKGTWGGEDSGGDGYSTNTAGTPNVVGGAETGRAEPCKRTRGVLSAAGPALMSRPPARPSLRSR